MQSAIQKWEVHEMRLNPSQVNSVVNYLQQIPTTPCPLCNQQEWKVSETIFALPEYVSPPIINLGSVLFQQHNPTESPPPWIHASSKKEPEVFPVIPIVCGRCGFVFFISAVAAGVIAAQPATMR